jgi:hypothetical protein
MLFNKNHPDWHKVEIVTKTGVTIQGVTSFDSVSGDTELTFTGDKNELEVPLGPVTQHALGEIIVMMSGTDEAPVANIKAKLSEATVQDVLTGLRYQYKGNLTDLFKGRVGDFSKSMIQEIAYVCLPNWAAVVVLSILLLGVDATMGVAPQFAAFIVSFYLARSIGRWLRI